MARHEMDAAYRSARYERDRDERGRPANARPRDRFGRPLPRGARDELAHAEEPEDVVSSLAEAFDRAVALFDEQRFFEAHEFLEHIWKSDWIDPADKNFWKGITQVAVGCCHVQRGNDAGAVTMIERAVGYLAPYPGEHLGVDVAALSARATELAEVVRARGASADLDFPRFPRAA